MTEPKKRTGADVARCERGHLTFTPLERAIGCLRQTGYAVNDAGRGFTVCGEKVAAWGGGLNNVDREAQDFWVVPDGKDDAVEVVGLWTPNGGAWFVPELGETRFEASGKFPELEPVGRLFPTPLAALEAFHDRTVDEIAARQKLLERLLRSMRRRE